MRLLSTSETRWIFILSRENIQKGLEREYNTSCISCWSHAWLPLGKPWLHSLLSKLNTSGIHASHFLPNWLLTQLSSPFCYMHQPFGFHVCQRRRVTKLPFDLTKGSVSSSIVNHFTYLSAKSTSKINSMKIFFTLNLWLHIVTAALLIPVSRWVQFKLTRCTFMCGYFWLCFCLHHPWGILRQIITKLYLRQNRQVNSRWSGSGV
jgi:hypothetical protein